MKELEDYSWFPEALRRQQTEYIGWMVRAFRVYRNVPELMRKHFPPKALLHLTDMGSGSGGPLPQLSRDPVFKESRFLLSDLYPQAQMSLPERCTYLPTPADARNYQPISGSSISFFNTFHHFSPEEQKAIITRHLSNGHCLLVAEILTPDIWCALRILLATTLGQVLLAPLVKPFRLSRLLFTWVIPVNLLTVTWDGLISVRKSPGKQLRRELAAHATALCAEAHWVQAGNKLLPVQLFLCIPAEEK